MGMVNRLVGWYCTNTQYPPNPPSSQVRVPLVERTHGDGIRQRVRRSVVSGVKAGDVLPGTHAMQPKPFRPTLMQVTKKLAPDQPGAKKLAQRYGEQLLCVRYRQDIEAGRRYTTVELVVDEGPMPIDKRKSVFVYLRIAFDDLVLRQAIRKHGGTWDKRQRMWRMHQDAVHDLQLHHQVLRNLSSKDAKGGRD